MGFICLKASGVGACTHNLICAQNINTCCCRHAACGFRSSFVKTTFNPITTAVRSFSRNPILAISEGFKRNLATATVVRFADIYFFRLRFVAVLFALYGDCLRIAVERKVEGVVVVWRSVTKLVEMIMVMLLWALQQVILRESGA